MTAQAFQPTLPARGATERFAPAVATQDNFNPRSPHGERQEAQEEAAAYAPISTHAPRTGSDAGNAFRVFRQGGISTHAPRTGSDAIPAWIVRL